MLSSIQIKDFAIIDRIELELDDGMTALTGETGAGKSILVDALLFVTGGRMGTDVIRHGCDKTEVTATFAAGKNSAIEAWFTEQAMDYEGECILRRALSNDGRSRAWVNGQSMPLQALRQLGETLVDIHGQMEYQSLMKRTAQRELLDTHGNHQPLNENVAACWKTLKTLRQQRADTEQSAKDRNERLTLLRYHVNELEALSLRPNEAVELNAERQRHAHSGKLAGGAREVAELMREADINAEQLLSRALNVARNLQPIDAGLDDTVQLLNEALIAAREAADAIQHYESVLDADPARQEWVEQRLAALEDAARKHRVEIDALNSVLDKCRTEVQQLESLEITLEQLDTQINDAQRKFTAACKQLSQARTRTADALSQRVTTLMQTLGMPGGQFNIKLIELNEDQRGEQGAEDIEFMVSANPGQPLKPLAKVASGGELSRISLSIQVAAVESVTHSSSTSTTLVFDEVDAGVGGGVAEMVGRQLRTLGQNAQVLCVTHLPQVASQAHAQARVTKLTDGKHTRTTLETLSKEARVEEIARMLGGAQITDAARMHATEMLNTATETRSRSKQTNPKKSLQK